MRGVPFSRNNLRRLSTPTLRVCSATAEPLCSFRSAAVKHGCVLSDGGRPYFWQPSSELEHMDGPTMNPLFAKVRGNLAESSWTSRERVQFPIFGNPERRTHDDNRPHVISKVSLVHGPAAHPRFAPGCLLRPAHRKNASGALVPVAKLTTRLSALQRSIVLRFNLSASRVP